MRYLFELNHPKHYHQFKNMIQLIDNDHNEVLIVARDKDVLIDLLKNDNINYKIIGKHGENILNKITVIPKLLFTYYKIVQMYKPDIILSKASPYAAIIGKLLSIPTVITPDSEIVSLTNWFTAPLSTLIITQNTFSKHFGKKHKKISGFFESTYLHPNYFIPNENEIFNDYLKRTDKFFVLRFIGWSANHDINQYGFSIDEKKELVSYLSKYGKVIITSEKNLPNDLKNYVMKIHPSKIHHLLKYADLYVGDSQSMATESCLLGTPSIRYNSFVGPNDMSNFKLLEDKYNLLFNCSNFEEVLDSIKKIFEDPDSKKKWLIRSQKYFSEIGDPNTELLNIVKGIE